MTIGSEQALYSNGLLGIAFKLTSKGKKFTMPILECFIQSIFVNFLY